MASTASVARSSLTSPQSESILSISRGSVSSQLAQSNWISRRRLALLGFGDSYHPEFGDRNNKRMPLRNQDANSHITCSMACCNRTLCEESFVLVLVICCRCLLTASSSATTVCVSPFLRRQCHQTSRQASSWTMAWNTHAATEVPLLATHHIVSIVRRSVLRTASPRALLY